VRRAYDEFVKRSMQIATAKDLDVLLAQLKGDSTDLLLKAVEEQEEQEASQPIEATNPEDTTVATSTANDTLTSASFIMPVVIEPVEESKQSKPTKDQRAKIFK
jgi:hypothetical protein